MKPPPRKRRKQRPRPDRGPGAFALGLDAGYPSPELLTLLVRRPCLLCGRRRCHWVGLFTPKDQERFRAPSGKVRTLAYALCLDCQARPDCNTAVESVLFHEAADLSRN